jgi:hypothetical protein
MSKAPKAPTPSCLLGGLTCIDGNQQMSCGRVDPYYCVPDALCASSSCPMNLPACINSALISGVKCTVPSSSAGGLCAGKTSATIDLHGLFALDGMGAPVTHCTAVHFVDLTPTTGPLQLSDTLARAGQVFTHGLLVGGETCVFDITWSSSATTPTGMMASIVDLELANGSHMLMPLRLEFASNQCTGGTFQCGYLPQANEKIGSCTYAP